MNDSTLTGALLTRLDALTSTMGVAATEVWSIWLATSWRPMAGVVLGLTLSLFAILLGGLLARWAVKKDDELFFFAGAAPFVIGIVVVLINLTHLPDAMAYLAEPRLYALDQLRGLVGK